MRPSLAVIVAVLVVVGVEAGCNRKTGPSPEFERAHTAFSKLYAQKLDEAYLDSAIPSILDDLNRVPKTSVDSPDAQALLARIAEGKARMEKEAEQRRNASMTARKVTVAFPNSTTPSDTGETLPPPVETPDASLAQPAAGMSRAEFEKRFGGCFEAGEPIEVQGRGIRDSYRLKDITNCRERHPGYDKLIVLMEGVSVMGIIPASSMFNAYADGGRAPEGPDAGRGGSSASDAGTAAAPMDAGATLPLPGTNYGDSGVY